MNKKNYKKTKTKLQSCLAAILEKDIPVHLHSFSPLELITSEWRVADVQPRLIINMGSDTELSLTSEQSKSEFTLPENHAAFVNAYVCHTVLHCQSILVLAINGQRLLIQHQSNNGSCSIPIAIDTLGGSDEESLVNLFTKLVEWKCDEPFAQRHALSTISLFLILVSKILSTHDLAKTSSKTIEKISKIAGYIREHYRDPSITRESAAKALDVNPSYLHKLLVSFTSLGFKENIQLRRLSYSRRLLTGKDMKISEIAAACGFNSSNHFIYTFKKTHGISPNQLRKLIQSDHPRTEAYLHKIHQTEGFIFAKRHSPDKLHELKMKKQARPISTGMTTILCNESAVMMQVSFVTAQGELKPIALLKPGVRKYFSGQMYSIFVFSTADGEIRSIFYLKDRNIIALHHDTTQ